MRRFRSGGRWPLALALGLAASPLGGANQASSGAADPERTAMAVEALTRLQGIDLDQNPKIRQAVLKVLEKTRGTGSFVKLVQQFKLTDQDPGLLEVAGVVNSSLELDAVLEHLLTQARGILQAESGSIMLADEGGQELRVLAAQGPRARNVRGRCRKVGEGVAGWVALYGRPLLLHGSTADPRVRVAPPPTQSIEPTDRLERAALPTAPANDVNDELAELIERQPEEVASILRGWLADRRG